MKLIVSINKSLILTIILIIHHCKVTTVPTIIRAHCIITESARWDGLLELTPMLENYGLHFVASDQNPDVILCNKVTREVIAFNTRIIILEKSAAASVTKSTKSKLHLPQVKAVFKDRILRDKYLNNIPALHGRYFYNLINDYAHLVPPIKTAPHSIDVKKKRGIPCLKDTELNKIKLVIWDIWGGPFNQQKFPGLVDYTINYKKNRKIDVFFAGKSKGNMFYKWHRTQALNAIRSIKGIKTLALDGKVLSFDEYIKTIKSSKIIVSPWGLGEWCFRDFEAIHCGAILIKPDTSFVLSYPDIYQNNVTYIPCKPDFSDLEELVKNILANFKHYNEMRSYAKKLVSDLWSMERIAELFVKNVREVLEE